MHNTEDKQWWVIEFAKRETLFVEKVCPVLDLVGVINPKKEEDPHAPDIVVNSELSDLKCQNTPFFKAGELYGLEPQFAVTFNRKDYERYSAFYPELCIYFWVDWQQTEMTIRGKFFRVHPMAGVWRTPFSFLAELIETGRQPLHSYQRRRSDTRGNAKDSYLFDLRGFECLRQIGPSTS